MKTLAILVALLAACTTTPDEVEPDAGATPDAAECPALGLPSCATFPCAADELDCPWPELSAPCACTEPTGLIHYCTR